MSSQRKMWLKKAVRIWGLIYHPKYREEAGQKKKGSRLLGREGELWEGDQEKYGKHKLFS